MKPSYFGGEHPAILAKIALKWFLIILFAPITIPVLIVRSKSLTKTTKKRSLLLLATIYLLIALGMPDDTAEKEIINQSLPQPQEDATVMTLPDTEIIIHPDLVVQLQSWSKTWLNLAEETEGSEKGLIFAPEEDWQYQLEEAGTYYVESWFTKGKNETRHPFCLRIEFDEERQKGTCLYLSIDGKEYL